MTLRARMLVHDCSHDARGAAAALHLQDIARVVYTSMLQQLPPLPLASMPGMSAVPRSNDPVPVNLEVRMALGQRGNTLPL